MRWAMRHRRGLRMFVLSILSSAPHNGVEIMDEIESATHGWWRPSPGSIYPLLEQLTQEELVHKLPDGKYELTAKARDEMEYPFGPRRRGGSSPDQMAEQLGHFVSYFEELKGSNPAKFAKQAPQLRALSDRLSKLSKE
jgi:DNA-binding PadR family transcriptional regulator